MRHVVAMLASLAGACSSSHDTAFDAAVDGPRTPAVVDARCDGQAGAPHVLVFSAENLWNHPSTPIAVQTLLAMCGTRGYAVVASHDPAVFLEQLPTTDVVVFAVTSGPVLSAEAQAVFEPWVRAGGGVVGIHSASATELEWPFFVDLMGGQFRGHGPTQSDSTVIVDDPSHPTMAGIGSGTITRVDEWYSFVQHPEAQGTTVLMHLDEATLPADYPADLLMGFHAITWSHARLGGRVFYTALGHMPDTYTQPWFVDMLGRAIDWTAAGHAKAR
jgi:type 1 glutamine amidotransferase